MKGGRGETGEGRSNRKRRDRPLCLSEDTKTGEEGEGRGVT